MLHTRKGGFTLIELMIVVAIIGILAAIAIPNFLQFQLRSKTGEAKTNIAAIRTAEEGYFAEFNVYVAATAAGFDGGMGANKRLWPNPVSFDQLGWSPEGEVFFDYAVVTNGSSYTIDASGDLDGNLAGGGATSDYGYIHPAPGLSVGQAGNFGACVGGGVFNPASGLQDLLNTVGPCNNLDGQSEF
jgi:type IV pilus assembly protein PilA